MICRAHLIVPHQLIIQHILVNIEQAWNLYHIFKDYKKNLYAFVTIYRPGFEFQFLNLYLYCNTSTISGIMKQNENRELRVVDFSGYPEPTGKEFMMMPDDEFNIYERYCNYIQLATSIPPGNKINADFYCPCEMEDGELCEGNVQVTQLDVPNQIRWTCSKCGDKGAIVNYEYTPWDNSHMSDEEKSKFLNMFLSDATAEDLFDDDDFIPEFEDELSLVDEFEYYVNPYDPDSEKLGGPTSLQVKEMLESDWTVPGSLLYLNDSLSLSVLEQSNYFHNARQFLLLLQELEEFPLTRTGYIKRRIVKKLLKSMRWQEPYVKELIKTRQHIDEAEVWELFGLRLLLDVAGLTIEDGNRYILDKEMEWLIEGKNAGKLYQLLFSTYFDEMNPGFFGTTLDLPMLQYSVPFILHRLVTLAEDWIPLEDFAEEALLFSVKVELDMIYEDIEDADSFELFYEDVLFALERFGVIESRKIFKDKKEFPITFPDQLRITPLGKEFVVIRS